MEYSDHPYGFVGFESHFEFTEAAIFCQNHNIDVLDFMLNGMEYLAIFSIDGFYALLDFCVEKDLDYVYFVFDGPD